jgi:glutamyl-tRNA synthetase
MPDNTIRVRIAPSPTGYLHLGTIRTAFFNYLFAKKEGGKFIIRTEDTDQGRSLPIYEQDILQGLKMLGVQWDEGPDIGGPFGPYRQSERLDTYKGYLERLIEQKRAYHCFCTKEELEEEKKAMLSQGLYPKYSGKCRSLSPEEADALRAQGKDSVIRLVVPSHLDIEFTDLIRGKISINTDTIGDFVIARSVDSPLYNFAVVIDDYLMQISHVIRGEEHITNTPRQILIAQALGIQEPKYAHLPLILSPDRKKLSKRNLKTSFVEYIKEGYLPEAIMNFIVLLGWHPEDDNEVMTIDEMARKFSIRRIQKAGAIFDLDKLEWFNSYYMKHLPIDDLAERVRPYVPEAWMQKRETLIRALSIERERMKKLADFPELAGFFFEIGEYEPDMLRWKELTLEGARDNLMAARDTLAGIAAESFDKGTLETALMPIADARGRGEVLWPLRVSLSGKRNSPSPFEILEALGKDESLRRIDKALEKIAAA